MNIIKYHLAEQYMALKKTNLFVPRTVVYSRYRLDDIIEHMAGHNSPYSRGVISGVLKDMVACIRELLLSGHSVTIDDLVSFTFQVRGCSVEKPDDWTPQLVKGLKLVTRGVGSLTPRRVKLDRVLQYVPELNTRLRPADIDTPADPDSPGAAARSGQQ